MAEMKKDFELEDMPRHSIYQVPDGYFDGLPMRIMERTAAKQQPQHILQPPTWRSLHLAFASLVLLLAFAGVYIFNTPEDNAMPQVANFTGLHDDAILDYLSNNTNLESADFEELNIMAEQGLAGEFLNVSPAVAEEELEYYRLDDLNY